LPVFATLLVWNSGHQFAQNNEIDDDSCSQKTVFADIIANKSVFSSHEDLTGVLIDSFLGVSSRGNILDNNRVIRVLFRVSWIIEQRIVKNILDAFWFGGFLGLELFLWGQVLAIVVAQVVVRHTWFGLDACTSEEIHEGGFEFGLACFEIIADQQSTEGGVFQARDEGILGWAVDENAVLLERCQGEDSWGCDFRVIFFDGFSYIFIGIIHSWNNKWVSFGVGSPKNYDCAQVVFLLEGSNIIADNLQVFGFFIAGEEVIGSVLLVGSDEVRVVDWFQRFVVFEEGLQLLLQLIVEDLCASHGAGKIQRVDIPSSNNEIFWVD
jgi:hypothetical protein